MPLQIKEPYHSVWGHMDVTNRRGDLPNLKKKEFEELLLAHANRDELMAIPHRHCGIVDLPDGRVLAFHHNIWPETPHDPLLHEWSAELVTLKQKTPRSLRKVHIWKAWMYLYEDHQSDHYKRDPSRTWSYSIWR